MIFCDALLTHPPPNINPAADPIPPETLVAQKSSCIALAFASSGPTMSAANSPAPLIHLAAVPDQVFSGSVGAPHVAAPIEYFFSSSVAPIAMASGKPANAFEKLLISWLPACLDSSKKPISPAAWYAICNSSWLIGSTPGMNTRLAPWID